MNQILAMADEECRNLWETLKLGYTHPRGHPLLRAEIANQYDDIPEESVLVTSSTEEALSIAFQALLKPGDHVVCPRGYEPHYHIPEALGASVDFWGPEFEGDSWIFDVDKLIESVNKSTKLVVLSFPHNPTGSLISHDDLQRICDFADNRGITVISDEVFRGIERNPADKLKSAAEVSRSAITCSGLSKVYGAAGLRIGWVIVHDDELRDQMLTRHYYSTICASAPSEVLALIAVRNTNSILADNCRKIETNLSSLSEFFNKHSDRFTWSTPSGGTIGLAKVNQGGAEEFSQCAAETASIMIAPSTVLDHGKDHIRIGYGRKNLPETLSAFDKYLSK